MNKPNLKTANPNFSSGPTTKRPGWTTKHLEFALLGRSHRSPDCKARLKNVIEVSKKLSEPWGMTFVDDNNLLITEKTGSIMRIDIKTGKKIPIQNSQDLIWGFVL